MIIRHPNLFDKFRSVREGYAVAYSQYSKDFVEDEKFAKENRLGIWSMSFQMPSDYRKASRNK